MMSPASTRTMSPTLRLVPGTILYLRGAVGGEQLGLRLGAAAPQRVGLRLAAAFGDGFGEVGEEHGEPEPEDDLEREAESLPLPMTRSLTNRTVVSAETTATTNITGFLASARGSSFTKAWAIAGKMMPRSSRLADEWFVMMVVPVVGSLRRSRRSPGLAAGDCEVLDDRSERQRREEGQAADDQDHADQQADEQRRHGSGNVPSEAGTVFFAASEPAIASAGTMTMKRPISMAMPSVMLYQGVLPESPPKAEPLLAAAEV